MGRLDVQEGTGLEYGIDEDGPQHAEQLLFYMYLEIPVDGRSGCEPSFEYAI